MHGTMNIRIKYARSSFIAIRISLTSALDGGGWSTPRPGRFTPGKKPDTHCIGGWLGPKSSLDGTENLTLTGIRYPDRPARSGSLY